MTGIAISLCKQPAYIILVVCTFLIVLIVEKSVSYIWVVIYAVTVISTYGHTNQYLVSGKINESYLKDSKSIIVRGYVDKVQIYEKYQQIYIVNPNITAENEKYELHGVIIYYTGTGIIKKGQTIEATGNICEFERGRNEGQFDMYEYYKSIGMDYQLQSNEIIIKEENTVLVEKLEQFRGDLSSSFDEIDENIYSGIYKAMVIGEKGDLSADVKELYKLAGISHILAISGLHIAIIGMGVYKALKRIGMNFLNSAIFSSVIIFSYGFITDNGVSTVRAIVMFAFFLGAQVLGRTYDMLTAASFSLMIILIKNPYMVTNAGAQMSFGAIFAIAFVFPVLKKWFNKKWLESLLLSLSINLVMTPIMAYHYFEISTYSLFLNVVVVPLMSLVMAGVWLGGISGIFSVKLGGFFVGISHYIIDFYNYLCELVNGLPYNKILLGKPELIQIVLYYTVILVVLFWIEKKEKLTKGILLPVGVILICIIGYHNNDYSFVTMLDVSQGDCIYVNFDKDINALIDCGSSDESEVGKYRVIPYLKANKIKHLSYIFLSHMDSDHTNGIKELLKNSDIEVEKLVVSYILENSESFAEIRKIAIESECEIVYMYPGMSFNFENGTISNIFPDKIYQGDENESSMVLNVSINGYNLLFTGDIGIGSEEYMLNKGVLMDVDILKVAHHGSKYSTGEGFLSKTLPEIGIISAGRNNAYGHPHKEVLERLNMMQTKILSTTECGQITLKLDKKGIRVIEYLK